MFGGFVLFFWLIVSFVFWGVFFGWLILVCFGFLVDFSVLFLFWRVLVFVFVVGWFGFVFVDHCGVSIVSIIMRQVTMQGGGGLAFLLLTHTGAAVAVRRKACPRRNLVCSATSAAASTSTTRRTVPRRRRCWRSRRTPLTTAAGARSGPTATPARCSGTGRPTATTTRPSDGAAAARRDCPRAPVAPFVPPAFVRAECQEKGQRFLSPSLPFPCPSTPESAN